MQTAQSALTVVTAAPSFDLIDTASVKDELEIVGGALDAQIGKWIKRASAAIAHYCNRVFPVETVKFEIWPARDAYPYQVPGGLEQLQLPRWPIVSVASVTENGIALAENVDFRIDAANGFLIRLDMDGYPRPWPALPIAVTFDGGFAIIPDDLADAALQLVKMHYFGRGRDPMLRDENVQGVWSAAYWFGAGPGAQGGLPPNISAILDNYRVPVLA